MIISEWVDCENEKTAILDLTRKVFGDVEYATPSYFDWQYRDNPQGKAIVLLAKDEEKNNSVIGLEVIIPTKVIVDQKIVMTSLSCNSAIDPAYRKQGVFSKLLASIRDKALKNGISSLYAVPNDESFNAFIKQGSVEIVNLPLLVRPLKLSKYFDTPVRTLLQPFDSIWKINKNINSDIEQPINEYNSDFETLTAKASKRISIIQKRDKEFLQWRYGKHPTRKYQTFVLKENSVLKGYIITRQTILNGKNIGVIVDFLVDAEVKNREKLKDLVKTALENFWKNDISLAIATCRNGLLENKILRETGFFTTPQFLKPQSLHFILMPFDANNQSLKKLQVFGNWFFSFGDYDVF